MGCTSEVHLSLSGGWIVREHRIYREGSLASESVFGEKVDPHGMPARAT